MRPQSPPYCRGLPLIEMLELRQLLTASPTFTVTFDDPGGAYSSWYTRVRATILAAAGDWASYINSSAKIDLSVDFDETLTAPTLATAGFDERVFFRQANGYRIEIGNVAAELRTGVDQNGSEPDAEISIRPGALNEFYFDATADRTGAVPGNQIDARSVLLHEIGHALGIFGSGGGPHDEPVGDRLVYDQYVELDGSDLYFTGPNAEAAYGGPVPLSHDDSSHIGNDDGPGEDIADDLMAPSIADGARRFISNIDVGVLADAGVPMKDSLIPAVSVADVTANKGVGRTASFVVTLSKAAAQTVVVPVQTVNGTAVAGRDYVAINKNVTFAPGETSKVVTVRLLAGSPFDKDETFTLNLGLPSNAALLQGQATGTLKNTTLASDASHAAVFTEANGNVVTITLRGAGVATINRDVSGNLDTVSITGSNAGTVLAVRSKKVAVLHGISAIGGLGGIDAPNTDFLGTVNLKGTTTVTFLDVLAGSTLAFGAAAKQLTFIARNVTDSVISDGGTIRSFAARAWVDTDDAGDLLKAAAFGSLAIKGEMQADVQSTGTIGTMSVGMLRAATVRAKGSVTAVNLGAAVSSNVFVGANSFAESAGALTNRKAVLTTLAIKGTFSDTRIAAPTITTANLGIVVVDNAGTVFGVAADTIGTLTASTPLQPKLKRVGLKSAQVIAEGDFVVRVL